MAHWNAHVFFCIWQVINSIERLCHDAALGSGSHASNIEKMNRRMTGMCPAGQYSWPNVTHQYDHKLTFEGQDWQGHYTGPVWLAVECNHSRHLLQMRSSSTCAIAAAMDANINYAPVLFACLCPARSSVLLFLPCSAPQGADLFELDHPVSLAARLLPKRSLYRRLEGAKKLFWPSSLAYLTSLKSALALLGLMLSEIVHLLREVQAVWLWMLLPNGIHGVLWYYHSNSLKWNAFRNPVAFHIYNGTHMLCLRVLIFAWV